MIFYQVELVRSYLPDCFGQLNRSLGPYPPKLFGSLPPPSILLPVWQFSLWLGAVFRIRIRIHMFLGLLDLDPDPSVRGMDPDPDPDLNPSLTEQKK